MSTTSLYPGCQCCGGPDPGCTAGCVQCPGGICKQWKLTVAGITNAGGGSPLCGVNACPGLNGTWTMTYVGGCVWTTSGTCCSGCGCWTLQYGTTGAYTGWYLTASCTNNYIYTVSGTFDCNGPNVFVFSATLSTATACNNFPATIAITPVCSGECIGCCSASVPATLHVTINTSGACASLDGSYAMTYHPAAGFTGCVGDTYNAWDSKYGHWRAATITLACGFLVVPFLACCDDGSGGFRWDFILLFYGATGTPEYIPSGQENTNVSVTCSPFAASFNLSIGQLALGGCAGCYTTNAVHTTGITLTT